MKKPRILIIEDSTDTRLFLEAMFAKDFDILSAPDGVIGIDYARNKAPDLIILDVTLPILSGYDACSLLKKDEKTSQIPIIFLSGHTAVTDITQGLAAGADDYVSKPFNYKELLARIQVRLRKNAVQSTGPLVVGDLRIDTASREVTFAEQKTQLTLTEYDILRYLASRNGTIVSREEILKEVWKEDSQKANDRTIDVHIRALRRKIPALLKHILSVYGVGYKYEI